MTKPTFTHNGTIYPPVSELQAKAQSHEDSDRYEMAYLSGSLIVKYEMARIDLFGALQTIERLNKLLSDLSESLNEIEEIETQIQL